MAFSYTQTESGWFGGLFGGDKYCLDAPYFINTGIGGYYGTARAVTIGYTGELLIDTGFVWDGASGPTWDTAKTARASCVHDALYLLMRLDVLPWSVKTRADSLLWSILRADGVGSVRAWTWLLAVDLFGGKTGKTTT